MTPPLRPHDTQLLRAFGRAQAMGIGELIEALGVTATAIRQRLQRLLDEGLIERQKVIAGRGRPAYEYRLTPAGRRCAGADSSALAEAMWQEILQLADVGSRRKLLAGVAKRLGQDYAQSIGAENGAGSGVSLAEKMRRLGDVLAAQQVATHCGDRGEGTTELPLLDIRACPYPALRDAAADRSMCQLEAEIFSEALGEPVHLSHCVLDGDASCHFVPVADQSPG